jgi:hypothetical protein
MNIRQMPFAGRLEEEAYPGSLRYASRGIPAALAAVAQRFAFLGFAHRSRRFETPDTPPFWPSSR